MYFYWILFFFKYIIFPSLIRLKHGLMLFYVFSLESDFPKAVDQEPEQVPEVYELVEVSDQQGKLQVFDHVESHET